jgi:hypothetical protein
MQQTTTICEMEADCKNPVTHIGHKGYVYCAEHAIDRRSSGYERCRRMRAWELKMVMAGEPLPSYEIKPKPVAA